MDTAKPESVLSSEAIWAQLRFEAREAMDEEAVLSSYLDAAILRQPDLASALAFHLAEKLSSRRMTALQIQETFLQAYDDDQAMVRAAERDMGAALARDPACYKLLQPFMFFKGFAALQSYRLSNWLWRGAMVTHTS